MYCTSYIITPLIPHFDSIEIPPIESPTNTIPDWTGRPDRSPLHFVYWTSCREDNCTLSIGKVTVCHLHQMMDDNKIIIEILVWR